MQASVPASNREHLKLEIFMIKALLVSTQDILSLRATLMLPQFSPILGDHPSLRAALEHPQPDFGDEVSEVAAAVSAVCENTNYPEDWAELSLACAETRTARRAYFEAIGTRCPSTPPAAQEGSFPQVGYALVYERPGSGIPRCTTRNSSPISMRPARHCAPGRKGIFATTKRAFNS